MMFYHKEYPRSMQEDQLDRCLAAGWFPVGNAIFTCSHLVVDEEQFSLHKTWWLRFDIDEIEDHRSHRRIRRKRERFTVQYDDHFMLTPEDNELYGRYLEAVNCSTCSIFEYVYGQIALDVYDTRAIRIFNGKKLIALGIFHAGENSTASIMNVYDPAYGNCSLGKMLMLCIIDRMKCEGLQFYYPGYLVSGMQEFDYKLFLGRSVAQCYYPDIKEWQSFREEMLYREQYADDEVLDYYFLKENVENEINKAIHRNVEQEFDKVH